MTHTDIKGLGYVKISTNDMARWRTFAFDVLGFAKGSGPDENALYLRLDERAARIVVVEGERDEIVNIGWEVADHAALRRVQEALEKNGTEVEQLSLAEADARRVEEVIALHRSRRSSHRGLPRSDPRPQPRGDALRRSIRHRLTGSRPRRTPRHGQCCELRLLHRGARLLPARRLPPAGSARIRAAANPFHGRQRAPPQLGPVPGTAWRCTRPDSHHGRGGHPRRRRPGTRTA